MLPMRRMVSAEYCLLLDLVSIGALWLRLGFPMSTRSGGGKRIRMGEQGEVEEEEQEQVAVGRGRGRGNVRRGRDVCAMVFLASVLRKRMLILAQFVFSPLGVHRGQVDASESHVAGQG